jgi:hypothetical protein
MTNLLDCMQEVIALGPGEFIRTDSAGPYRPSQWEPTALLDDMQHESPLMLDDYAWTEWSDLPGGGRTCSINYGRFGVSLGHQEVPGYGHLRVFELSHRRPESLDIARSPSAREHLFSLLSASADGTEAATCCQHSSPATRRSRIVASSA